jgi:ABC-type glutathione transport system ATPase component
MNNSPDSKILWAKTTTVPSVAEVTEKAGGDDPAHRKVIRVTSITAKWTNDLSENTLTSVSLDVRPGGLVAIIGPVGSGKVNYTCIITCYSAARYHLRNFEPSAVIRSNNLEGVKVRLCIH